MILKQKLLSFHSPAKTCKTLIQGWLSMVRYTELSSIKYFILSKKPQNTKEAKWVVKRHSHDNCGHIFGVLNKAAILICSTVQARIIAINACIKVTQWEWMKLLCSYLCPNNNVDFVSTSLYAAGEQQMTIVVRAFPPRLSWRIRVSLLSRYGTYDWNSYVQK